MRLIYIISLASIYYTELFGQSDCVLRKDKDGVKVYACQAEHTKFKSLKAVFEVHTTPQQLIDVILNVDEYSQWQYHTINSHILEQKSNRELVYYTEIVSPWPASNRDLVVKLNIEQDATKGHLMVNANSIPDYTPEKEGIVRVPMSKSQWIVNSLNASTLSVEFTMLVDPGGSVPSWLINLVAAEAPYESFRNLKNRMEHPVKK